MSKDNRSTELRTWREEAMRDLDRARTELVELQRRVQESQERLELLDRLLSLETSETTTTQSNPSSKDELAEACEELLRQAGKPLHISELHRGLVGRGVLIPGKGLEANVIVRLHRAPNRFVRTGRGTFGLPDFGLPEVHPTRLKRRGGSRRSKQ